MPVGSIVILKSGGPKMTITGYRDGMPVCQYWANGRFEELKTFKDNLIIVPDTENKK